ncbi:MAG TPA: hypothetical protein VMI11_01445 [Actinomycetes bacterium]|nr:hypothetical protein [Actinomycetes bacterium]
MNRAWALVSAAIYMAALVGSIVLDGNAPDSGVTPGAKVIAFYTSHRGAMTASSVVVVVAAVFAVVSVGALREYLCRDPRARMMATTALAGAAVYAGSLCLSAGAALALADAPSQLDPAAAQALSLLRADVNTPFASAGTALLLGCMGWAIVQTKRLPAGLAWAALVLAVVALIPPIAPPTVLVAGVWLIIAGVVIYRRNAPEPIDPTGAHR